jgi:threonine dehydrogenase-like Zn-dependent dehydrogenase
MNKNLRLNMGNCLHRAYIPRLIELVRSGAVDPLTVLTQAGELTDAIAAACSNQPRSAASSRKAAPGRRPQ